MKPAILDSFLHSFPIQLVFHHLKKNLILLVLWMLFVATVLGGIGPVYGIHLLFLDPEYLGKVNFVSFFIVGLALGNFVMAFHITTYILNSHYFSFIGVLERPFRKYVVNNSILPLIGVIIYLVAIVRFQLRQGNELSTSMICVAGIVSGSLVMIYTMNFYFRWTNKDIFKYLTGSVDKRLRRSALSRNRVMSRLKETKQQQYLVTNYFDQKLRNRSCRDLMDFYNKEAIIRVFDQNHFNSVLAEGIVILLILSLAWGLEYPFAQIPAAASTLLLFSMIIMLLGAVSYWFKSWGVAFLFGLFILANFGTKLGFTGGLGTAGGLNYFGSKSEYSLDRLNAQSNPSIYMEDVQKMESALNSWKAKNQKSTLPKLNILCVSGGGQRAALWTVNVLGQINANMGADLMDKTVLITGASGGMIGAAYHRELLIRQQNGDEIDLTSDQWLENIAKDNLNPIILGLVTNDALFRFRRRNKGQKLSYDRGYVFEDKLNNNLGGILDKRLSDYQELEGAGKVPVMIFAPVIANDGRKLYLSASPISFMAVEKPNNRSGMDNFKVRGVDFARFFQEQGASDLTFLSTLRMSASFPYISPTISLPSEPRIEVMDAGISDNFGISDALHFIGVFQHWIEANTSGVVLTVIRDTHKLTPIDERSIPSIMDRFTNPISSVYNNLSNMQDISNDSRIVGVSKWLEVPLDIVEFEYEANTQDQSFLLENQRTSVREIKRASLSWHLTADEKRSIINNINAPNNQNSLRKLIGLLDVDEEK